MYVSRVVYARLINTGNYENERFEAEVILHRSESHDDAFILAKQAVARQVHARFVELEDTAPILPSDEIPY